jgi:hypothetical protein
MRKEEITALAIRLFAILLVFYILRNIPAVFIYLTEQESVIIWALASLNVFLLLAAVLMWKFPFSVAKWISPYSVDSKQTSWSSEVLLTVGCTLLGIFYLYYALSDLLYWLMFWQYNQNVAGLIVELTPDQKANIIVTLVEFALAVFLVVGAGGISKAIHRLRYSGATSCDK